MACGAQVIASPLPAVQAHEAFGQIHWVVQKTAAAWCEQMELVWEANDVPAQIDFTALEAAYGEKAVAERLLKQLNRVLHVS